MATKRRGLAGVLAAQTSVTAEDTATPEPDTTAAAGPVPVPSVPLPYEATGDGALDERERADLAACEGALDELRLAFARAGQALQVIRDARLYRETHPNFEQYVEDRWQMSRPQAYRLIGAWPLARALSPIGDTQLNEGQVRELLPLADRHGQDAAVAVYEELARADGVRVTAALIRNAIAALPGDRWDRAKAVEQIRAYLAGELAAVDPEDVDPVKAWEAEAERLRSTVRRVVTRPAWRTAAREHPDQARAVIAELRELLDAAERETGAGG